MLILLNLYFIEEYPIFTVDYRICPVIMNKDLLDLSDDTLIERYREGDSQCFDVLLERYMPYVMYWIRQSTDNEEDVSDLFQEISLRVSQKLKNVYQGKGYFPAWLHCVVSNFLHSEYRKKRPKLIELSTELLNSSRLTMEEQVTPVTEECLLVLKNILKEQPEHLQQIIRMRFWDNYTYQEISARTGVNMSTVVKRLKTTYMKMRRLMEERGVFIDS